MTKPQEPAIWFPALRAGSGADVFTIRLAKELNERGIRAEITWLPPRSEYAPQMVRVPEPPAWANVVHVNTWLHPRFIPSNLPIVATLHHAVHHPDARAYKGALRAAYHQWWIAAIERRVMRQASKVIAVSQSAADSARQSLIDMPIQVIHNGVDTGTFRPGTRRRQAGEPFRLLYVGSWMERKGVDLLALILRELGEGFELHYTGGPTSKQDKASMPANMVDIGCLRGDIAVAAAMQSADALLFPSRSEGFGLVAVEAMACGLPVIATSIAPLAEVVANGETGLLCPLDDVVGFVAAVHRLADDEILQCAMRSAAPNRVLERFSQEAMVKAYLDAYGDTCSTSLSLGA